MNSYIDSINEEQKFWWTCWRVGDWVKESENTAAQLLNKAMGSTYRYSIKRQLEYIFLFFFLDVTIRACYYCPFPFWENIYEMFKNAYKSKKKIHWNVYYFFIYFFLLYCQSNELSIQPFFFFVDIFIVCYILASYVSFSQALYLA